MTAAAVSPSLEFSRIEGRELARWGVAAALIVVLHLAVVYALQVLRSTEQDGGPPPALMIELAPVAFAPPVPEETVAADPVQSEAAEPVDDAEEISELPPEPVVAPEPTERATAEEATTVPAQTEAETAERVAAETLAPEPPAETASEAIEARPVEETAPEIAETVAPGVALPIPQPRPVQLDVETAKPVAEEAAKPAKKKKNVKPAEKQAEAKKKPRKPPAEAAAAAKTDAKPAPKAAAPKKSEGVAAPRVSPAKWQAKVLAWLNRHKRYPAGAKSRREQGSVQVAFTIDASGRVTSSRVARSSGNRALDGAALDMVRRSSPVPAPPKEVARSQMRLTVPVQFSLR